MDTMTTDTRPGLAEIEDALDMGSLWIQVAGARYWKVRRNGATRTWKKPIAGWRVPVKFGFRYCTQIDASSDVGWVAGRHAFVISDTEPRVQK